jgi:hypothetical protein
MVAIYPATVEVVVVVAVAAYV